MKMLLIQLSDIHFKENGNSLLDKQDQLCNAIRNSTLEYDQIFLLVTGDSAFSGKAAEFEIANSFLIGLKCKLEEYSDKKVYSILIPGNHDCDFSQNGSVRKSLMKLIQQTQDESTIDDEVIEQLTVVQKDYFSFRNNISVDLKPVYDSPLLTTYHYVVNEKSILFHCYNTSFVSEIREQNGKLFFPVFTLPEDIFNIKADIIVSMFHHPFHWLNPKNKREFSTHIHKTSDIFLTGHEHISSREKIDDLDGNIVYHIEGSVLQDSEDCKKSEFNLIGINLENRSFKIENYFWNGNIYENSTPNNKWIDYERGKLKLASKYNLSEEFLNKLNDVGGKFRHPNVSDIKLEDIYVFPFLRQFELKEKSEKNPTSLIENAESVVNNLKIGSKLLLFGSENIGKTSLLRIAFKMLYQKGFIPIIIDGKTIKNFGIDDFKRIVEKAFIGQYGDTNIEEFRQEDVTKIFILIDDIDKNPLRNQKSKGRFIKSLANYYKNIFLIGSEIFAIEEILSHEKAEGDLFSEFQHYEIMEFSYSMRSKLVRKWYTLGKEDYISDEEIYKKIDNAMRTINTGMGQGMVPNYPIFLLILLQAVETTNPHDLQISSYGNYYQLLILKSLTENIREQSELNIYLSYCAELAHYFFDKKTSIISLTEFIDFHKDISRFERNDLPTSMSYEKTLDKLCKVGVLQYFGDNVEFKYQYVYYYFEAKYLARHISEEKTKDIISKLCQRLYRTEFANIFMFLIHFNNDQFILDELLKNAIEIFNELNPCKLENDIDQLHLLVKELPKLYLSRKKSVEEVREVENKKLDEIENNKPKMEVDNEWDLNEDVSQIDIFSKLNLSFKLIEILGQIIKNNPSGSMSGPLKHQMLKETYILGLRTLNIFFSVLNDNTEAILDHIKNQLAHLNKVEDEKVENVARNILFSLCTQLSYIFLRKISDSIGAYNLIDKFSKVQEELNFASVKLVNFLIKLDHTQGFPNRDLLIIKKEIERHPLSYYLLKRIVVNHLHRHHVSYKDKQRICSFLNITMERQFEVEASRKKLEVSQ